MRFEIIGEKEKIKSCLSEFIVMVEKEYQVKKENMENKLKTFGICLPEFKVGYYEEGEKIIFFNSLPVPKFLNFIMKTSVKKMEKNLESYLKEKGVEAKVKFIGN